MVQHSIITMIPRLNQTASNRLNFRTLTLVDRAIISSFKKCFDVAVKQSSISHLTSSSTCHPDVQGGSMAAFQPSSTCCHSACCPVYLPNTARMHAQNTLTQPHPCRAPCTAPFPPAPTAASRQLSAAGTLQGLW